MILQSEPTEQDIKEAHIRIRKKVHHTPVLTSSSLNALFNCRMYFKCENFQKVGAFKFRGACNTVFSLEERELQKGVATHSSGNHAAAVALSGKLKNIPSYIVMPRTAPEIKKKAVEGYGAKIFFCESTLKAREETLAEIVEDTGASFIHPYDNYSVIAGQATCSKEIFDEISDIEYLIVPTGGGGLLSGSCLSAKYFSPETKVIGVEPQCADDAYRSIRDNTIYPSVKPQTICDGLLTQLSERTFSIIKSNVHEIITVTEESIISAMKMIWERMKLIIEPSGAITLAAIMENIDKFERKRVALILTGGNVDLEKLPWNK